MTVNTTSTIHFDNYKPFFLNTPYNYSIEQLITFFYCDPFILLKGAYAGTPHDYYSYIRGMRKFELPIPDDQGQISKVILIEEKATVDTVPANAHDVAAVGVGLARRDLNVVPSFLPGKRAISSIHYTYCYIFALAIMTQNITETYLPAGDNKPAQCSPGAVILSGVFNQDGSNAPYLQPVSVNFNPTLSPVTDPKTKIPVYKSHAFFQLFNNYDCANAQLVSQKAPGKDGKDDAAQYNVLLGGVSFFFKTPDSVGRLPISAIYL